MNAHSVSNYTQLNTKIVCFKRAWKLFLITLSISHSSKIFSKISREKKEPHSFLCVEDKKLINFVWNGEKRPSKSSDWVSKCGYSLPSTQPFFWTTFFVRLKHANTNSQTLSHVRKCMQTLFTHSHTHTLFLSLSLTHTHKRTHTLKNTNTQ